jgi:hypothetical protein
MKISNITDILAKAQNKGMYSGEIIITISRGKVFDVSYLIRDWVEQNVDGIVDNRTPNP